MSLPNVLAILVLVVALPLCTIAAGFLWYLSHKDPGNRVLRVTLVAAFVLWGIVLVFGLIFFNNDRLPPPIDLNTTKIVTRFVILAGGVVASAYLLWVWLLSNGHDE